MRHEECSNIIELFQIFKLYFNFNIEKVRIKSRDINQFINTYANDIRRYLTVIPNKSVFTAFRFPIHISHM